MKFEVGKIINTSMLNPTQKKANNFLPKTKLKYLSKIEVLFETGEGTKSMDSVLWQYECVVTTNFISSQSSLRKISRMQRQETQLQAFKRATVSLSLVARRRMTLSL